MTLQAMFRTYVSAYVSEYVSNDVQNAYDLKCPTPYLKKLQHML